MSVDIDYLKQIGEFCVTYGPWAVAIFEGFYILKIQRDHKTERESWESKRTEEREFTINKYQNYHDEVVDLVDKSSNATTNMAGKMMNINSEVKMVRRAVEQYFSLITEGVVKIVEVEVPDDIEETISDFMPDANICFKPVKKKD